MRRGKRMQADLKVSKLWAYIAIESDIQL